MSLLSLGFSYIMMAVITKKQYEGKSGLPLTMIYYGTEIFSCFLLSRVGYPLILCIIPIAVLCAAMMIREVNGFRFLFDIRGLRFVSVHLVSSLGMFVVYLFGLRRLCTDPVMLAAYNMMSMCSDTQWDIVEGAVDKHTTIGICDGTWKESKALFEGFLYGVILLVTTAACIFICSLLPVYQNSIDFGVVWILVIFEDLWFVIDGISNVMEAWMSFEQLSRIQPFLMVFVYVIRTSVTIGCHSVWTVSIAMACAEGFYIISTSCLYFVRRRGHVKTAVSTSC